MTGKLFYMYSTSIYFCFATHATQHATWRLHNARKHHIGSRQVREGKWKSNPDFPSREVSWQSVHHVPTLIIKRVFVSKDLRVYKCWFEDYELNENRNSHGVRVERDAEADTTGLGSMEEPGADHADTKDESAQKQQKPKTKPKPKTEPKAKTAEQLARAATWYNIAYFHRSQKYISYQKTSSQQPSPA